MQTLASNPVKRRCIFSGCITLLSRYNSDVLCFAHQEKLRGEKLQFEAEVLRTLPLKLQDVYSELPEMECGMTLIHEGRKALVEQLKLRHKYEELRKFCIEHGIKVPSVYSRNGQGHLWKQIVCMKNKIEAAGLTFGE